MQGQLVEQQDGAAGRIYPLCPMVTSIGRDGDNGIVLASNRIAIKNVFFISVLLLLLAYKPEGMLWLL